MKKLRKQTLVLGLLAAAIYGIMVAITLPQLQEISGLVPFDMRPGGYSAQEARQLLSALGEDGRWFYLTRQLPLDTIYPCLLASTLVALFRLLARGGVVRWPFALGVVLSVAAAGADYAENLLIALMLRTFPAPTDTLAVIASMASVTKAALTTLAVSLLILLAILRALANVGKRFAAA